MPCFKRRTCGHSPARRANVSDSPRPTSVGDDVGILSGKTNTEKHVTPQPQKVKDCSATATAQSAVTPANPCEFLARRQLRSDNLTEREGRAAPG